MSHRSLTHVMIFGVLTALAALCIIQFGPVSQDDLGSGDRPEVRRASSSATSPPDHANAQSKSLPPHLELRGLDLLDPDSICPPVAAGCQVVNPEGAVPFIDELIKQFADGLNGIKLVLEAAGVEDETAEILVDPSEFLFIDDPLSCLLPLFGALENIPDFVPKQVKVTRLPGKLHVISEYACMQANVADQVAMMLEEQGLDATVYNVLRDAALAKSAEIDELSSRFACEYAILVDAQMYICGAVAVVLEASDGDLFEELLSLILDVGALEDELIATLLEIDQFAEDFLASPPILPAVMAVWQYACHLDIQDAGSATAHVYLDAGFRPDETQFFDLADVDLESLSLNGLPAFSAEIKDDVIVAKFGQGGTGTLEEPCPLTLVVTGLLRDGTPFLAMDPAGNPHFATRIKDARRIMRDLGFLLD